MAKFDLRDYVPVMLDFEEYLKNRNLTQGSVQNYFITVKSFLFSEPELDSVDAYNEYLFEHAVKKRSKYAYDALKLFIKFHFEGAKSTSLQRNLLKPKAVDPKKVVRHLDEEDREGVIKLLLNYKHRVIARIQNELGVRAGDVIRLLKGSISYEVYGEEKVVMRIDFEGKGGKRFVKWIFDEELQTQIDLFVKSNNLDDEYYFLERKDDANVYKSYIRNYQIYSKDLKQALKFYGANFKDWSTHDFRRGFARRVWDKTKDPVVLKEMLNHSQFETTLRYLRGSGLQVKDAYYALYEDKSKEEKTRND